MNKKNEVEELTKLLNGTSLKTNKAVKEILNTDTGITEVPYIPKVKTKNWAGLKVPKKVYEICEYFKKILSEKGLYSIALDFSIYSAAVQYVLYNEMMMRICDPDCPMTSRPRPNELLGVAEALRKALRELGITRGTCGVHGNDNLDDRNDPIADLLKSLDENSGEEVVIKHKDK